MESMKSFPNKWMILYQIFQWKVLVTTRTSGYTRSILAANKWNCFSPLSISCSTYFQLSITPTQATFPKNVKCSVLKYFGNKILFNGIFIHFTAIKYINPQVLPFPEDYRNFEPATTDMLMSVCDWLHQASTWSKMPLWVTSFLWRFSLLRRCLFCCCFDSVPSSVSLIR